MWLGVERIHAPFSDAGDWGRSSLSRMRPIYILVETIRQSSKYRQN